MIRRCFHQVSVSWLALVGLVVPALAATVGEQAATQGLNVSSNASSPYTSPLPGVRQMPAAGRREQALNPTLSHPLGEGGTPSRPEYRITRWTVENGLPQNSIRALAQTRDGYLWIGTLKGLVRFDGVRFKVFDQSNTPGMTHDSINDLAVDEKDGGLWIVTEAGLFYYRNHQFERYGPEEGIPGQVGPLCPAREGGVWFSPQPGRVALARNGRTQTWEFGLNRIQNTVHQLGEEGARGMLLLLGQTFGDAVLHRLNLNSKLLTPLNVPVGASPLPTACFSFLQDADELLWLCTGQGIWRGGEGAWTRITSADPESGVWPQRVYPTSDRRVWVTQFEGGRVSLQRLVGSRLEPFAVTDQPSELNITRVLEDREGDLWAGTTTGLLRLEPKRINVYSRRDGLRNDETQAVAEGADGTIWVATARGLSGIRNGKIENLPWSDVKEGWNEIKVFLADRQNALWAGIEHRWLGCFRQGAWRYIYAPGEGKYLTAIHEDREGRLWFGTGAGVLCTNGGKWSYFSVTNGLSHPDVRVIYQDRRGDMWFGTFGGGLNCLRNGTFTTYKTSRGDLNNRAWWIHEDTDGVFWVSTEDGLNRFVPPGVEQSRKQKAESRNGKAGQDEGRFFTFTTEQGLGENVVNNIQEDEFGCLWLSGLRGVYRVPRQQLNEVAAGQRATVECVAFGEADGMLNSECNGGDNQPAGCKDVEGRIWFPTMQGVVVIDPKEMQRTELPPPVVIEQVRANGEVVFGDGVGSQKSEVGVQKTEDRGQKAESGGALAPNIERRTSNAEGRTLRSQPSTLNHRLAPGHARVLEIHYTANCLTASERVAFKYRLDGYDRDWLWDDQNRRVAFYTNLRPGNYTFQVRARGPHGTWNTKGDQFSFHVAPHFYETWPFYVGSVVAVLSAGLGLHYRRVRGLRRVQLLEQQRSLQEERARIAKDLHDDLGANLTGLALRLDVMSSQGPAGDAQHSQLATLARSTRGLVDNMREVVWAMNSEHDNVESLASFLGQYTEQYLAAAGLRCRLELPVQVPGQKVNSHTRHQLYLALKEALHNIVRHARASEVRLRLEQEPQELRLAIEDDGCGLPPDGAQVSGHGLDSMKQRVIDLGGEFSATTKSGMGTRIEIRIPLGHSTISSLAT